MYRIVVHKNAAGELFKLDREMHRRVSVAIDLLAPDPRRKAAPLQGELEGLWRIRAGNYRVVYRIIESEKIVLVVSIRHRREVYRAH